MILDLCLGTLSNGFRKWPSVGYPHYLFIHFWEAKIFYEDIRARGWRDSAQFKCRMFSDISIVDVDSWQLMSHVGWSDSKTADYFCRATKIIDATETALTLAKTKKGPTRQKLLKMTLVDFHNYDRACDSWTLILSIIIYLMRFSCMNK